MAYMVMSATTMTADNWSDKRCFETNVVGIATKEEGDRIAAERNKAERAAGHTNVDWYCIEELPSLDEMMAMMKGRT